MSITFPRTDIMTMVSYSSDTQPPQLVSRQEMSRQNDGRTIGKDLGPALWKADYATIPLLNDAAIAFEAALDSLDGVIQTFEACDLRRLMPLLYPGGTGANNGTLLSVNANNKALALAGLAAGQVVSIGDYLSFSYGSSRALHRAVEAVTANGSGVTAQFEVRPHLRTGWTLSPSTAVTLKNPRGIFSLVPGSVSSKSYGALYSVVSFQAVQAIE